MDWFLSIYCEGFKFKSLLMFFLIFWFKMKFIFIYFGNCLLLLIFDLRYNCFEKFFCFVYVLNKYKDVLSVVEKIEVLYVLLK